MEKKTAKMGRPKTAMEPAMYVGVTKTCMFCSSTNGEYKFLNNKNIEQPRYKCLECKKYFTHNPNSQRKKHPQGYSKIASSNVASQELPNNAIVSCMNPSCGKVGTSKFLFFNNGKVSQPRYKCQACNTTFTHGGRLSSKRNFEDTIQDVGELCGIEEIAQPNVLGNNKKVKLSSRRRKEESDDSSDEDSEIDKEEIARLDEMAEMDILRHKNVLNNQDSDSHEDEEEPSEFVKTLKLCNWCKSPNTEFCKSLKCGLLEYQCQDCCEHLKFDGETQSVLPVRRQSLPTKYNLRCTRNSEADNPVGASEPLVESY